MPAKTKIFLLPAGVVLPLITAGYFFNDEIAGLSQGYSGFLTVISLLLSGASIYYSFLYNLDPDSHLLINRALLRIRRTHTYWLPHFHFEVRDAEVNAEAIFEQIQQKLKDVFGDLIRLSKETTCTYKFDFDRKIYFIISFNENGVDVFCDRELLVPSHLYDSYRANLQTVVEAFQLATKPESCHLAVTITFGDGIANPYYGLFVQRIPSQLLRSFEASFVVSKMSSCTIEATSHNVVIDGSLASEVFSAFDQVLALKAMPARS